MSARDEAFKFADQVFDSIVEVAFMAAEKRREQACWWEIVARHRLASCARIMRPYWRWRLRKHAAQCAARRELQGACALASARVRNDGRA